MEMHHPRHQPKRKTQIHWYLAVQIQIENLVQFEFVPGNLNFRLWQIGRWFIFSGNCHRAIMHVIQERGREREKAGGRTTNESGFYC